MVGPADITVLCEIADGARVSPDARIGDFCAVGPEAVIGAGTALGRRVSVLGRTIIGRDNLIQDGCVLGAAPQDLKFHGRPTWLMIGDRNRLGPNVTAHVGTEMGGYLTRVGDDNVLETGAHVAHDCFLDDRTRLGASVLLGGHVRVQTGAVIGEMCGLHHFTTVGRFSRIGPRTPVHRDVPPFVYFASLGYYTSASCERSVHQQGLRAAGLSPDQQQAVREAVDFLFQGSQPLAGKVQVLLARGDLPPPVRDLCEFCRMSLQGRFGRHREGYRGRMPPEARQYLPAEFLAGLEGTGGP